MTMYYSATNKGFYDDTLKERYEASGTWPDDALQITDELYRSLMKGQQQGKVIGPDSHGRPTLTDPVIDWQADAETHRQRLLTAANAAMTVWEREESADILDEEDKARLMEWIRYAKALRKLDLSLISDEAEHNAIIWPKKPE
ncbi:tail fiber assembly protein [Pantoea agglomerans]|uniref:tail fiber assembly protein n=1 Tax=Enterobacter agglomerans TaxID=549 RepID=UPI001782A55D|nr:tail fiber assembly protein [Pantoea agglomerans]WVL84754.1 tail fiber assembly protein [Pantoea agglomerans]